MRKYSSTEDYQRELVRWGKEWINLYCSRAVTTSPEGEIALIKGKALFRKELFELCEENFSPEEIAQYQQDRENLLEQMRQMHRKSKSFIKRGGMIVMEYLHQVFSFDEFEWYLFCMAFMVEIEPQFERLFVLLQDDFAKKAPTIDLCVRMYTLDEEEQNQLKNKVIQRWGFWERFFNVESIRELEKFKLEGVLSTPLCMEQRIVKFIYDMDSSDQILDEAVTLYLPTEELSPMLVQKEQIDALKRMYQGAKNQGFVYISGPKDSGKKFLVRHFCKEIDRPVLMVSASEFIKSQYSAEWLVKRLAREAILKGNAIVCVADISVENGDEVEAQGLELLLRCFKETHLTPIFTSSEKWHGFVQTWEQRCMEFTMAPITVEERGEVWKQLLKVSGLKEKIDTQRLARTYKLLPGAIVRVVEEIQARQILETSEDSQEKQIYQGCQRQLVHKLGKDAVRVPAQYTMEDLVLPKSQKKALQDACDMVEYHHQVFDTWGFDKKMAYGKGVSMIFYGPPGTGKTMGAQAMANHLNLELYRVDMASVLSKYVGDSEKKLGNIFEQGQKSQSILFFDEADALFGKRSEVKDSQDKYANASTAFLLQKLEEYQGIIILATNLLQNFDTAFCRRFQFIIEFPFPDIQRREEIWRKVFPDQLPKEDLDYAYLAEEFVLSGSQIKNIAVGAAFLAAGQHSELKMVHILENIKREMKKNGKNMIASDFGVYYSLMEHMEGD